MGSIMGGGGERERERGEKELKWVCILKVHLDLSVADRYI
jgi:hypothetical protein